MKNQKGFIHIILPIVLLLIGIGGLGYFAYKNQRINELNPQNTSSPSLSDSSQNKTSDSSANLLDTKNWKIYKNEESGFEFMYPENLEMGYSDNNNPFITSYNLQISLIPKDSDPTSYSMISFLATDENLSLEKYFEKRACNPKAAKEIFNSLLGGNTAKEFYCENYSIPVKTTITKNGKYVYELMEYFGSAHTKFYSAEQTEKLYRTIISTFKFIPIKEIPTGTVTGKLCYPDTTLPKGEIAARNISTNKFKNTAYPGSNQSGKDTYSITLPVGKYHIRYQAYGKATSPDTHKFFYHTKCANDFANLNTEACKLISNHKIIETEVSAGKTTTEVNLCESPTEFNLEKELNESF